MTNGRHQPPKPLHDREGRLPGPRRMLVVGTAVGLVAIATGISLATFSSPSGQTGHNIVVGNGSSAASARSAQPTPPVASSTTGPNITSAGISKTALQYPTELKDQMLRWTAGRGGAAWSAVTTQLGNVSQAGGTGFYAQLRLECVSLGLSVQAARSAPAIPDEVMQRSYTKVLARLSVTAADCRNAISVRQQGDESQQIKVNKILLDRSLGQFAAESKQLYTATAEIRTLRR